MQHRSNRRWTHLWHETPASTRWGCFLLMVIILIGAFVIDPHARPELAVTRLRRALAAAGVPCSSPHYWWSHPKGQSTLNCDRYQIDHFNNRAEVATFVGRATRPREAKPLKQFGVRSYLVIGPRWVVTTSSAEAASAATRAIGGRMLPVSEG
jgi:hypothetical protein